MRILHVMDHSLPRSDGYSIRAKYLLEAQAAAGHEVVVLTSPSQGAEARDTESGGLAYRRSQYTRAEARLAAVGGKQLVFGRAITRGMRRLFETERFDLVHAHTPFTVARPALAMARRMQIPFIYEKRNLWEESARTRGKLSGRWPFFQLSRAVDRWVTRRSDAVCTITRALRDHTIALGAPADRVFVVGNGVDTAAFQPREPSPGLREECLQSGSFVFGFIGSFFSFEGLPLLVDAFDRLRRRLPGVRMVLVGDGEDRSKVAQVIAERSLTAHVLLTGVVAHSRVADFYAAIDVLVYPRYRTNLTEMVSPLKPLEPMAMGRCVLGSDVGGIRELVLDGETGLLFAADDSNDLENKMFALASGEIDTRSLGAAARRYVIANREWKHMSQMYGAAYERALRGG